MKKFISFFVTMVLLITSVNLSAQDNTQTTKPTPPSFDGGDVNKFIMWVFSNIKYPEEAYKNNIKGKVIVSFVITKSGDVKDVEVMKSSGNELLDNEAVRVVSLSPKWEPAKVKGEAVNISYTIPVLFDLRENPKDTDAVSYDAVDEKPTFQGKGNNEGNNEFTKWMFSQLEYPDEAIKNKIMGRTLLEFIITKEGKVKNVTVLKSAGNELLDNEAVRVISLSPDWEPGKINGTPVNVRYTFPVIFMLR